MKITLEIEENPTTGYTWQVIENKAHEIVEDTYTTEHHYHEGELLIGGGGTRRFVLQANMSEKSLAVPYFELQLVRPWEPDKPVRQVSLIVMNIVESKPVSEEKTK